MLSLNQIETIKEQAYVGAPSILNGVCKVVPMTMYDIIAMGTNNYNAKLGLLLLTEIDIAKIIKEKTGQEPNIEEIYPLSYLLQSAAYDGMFFIRTPVFFFYFYKGRYIITSKN